MPAAVIEKPLANGLHRLELRTGKKGTGKLLRRTSYDPDRAYRYFDSHDEILRLAERDGYTVCPADVEARP
jgi:hypothetical protein